MYNLFLTILLTLPCFGFATPAQRINPLILPATGPLTANAIGPEPIDPRFTMQALYQAVPLAEDDCLVAAVQLLGGWGSNPFTGQEPSRSYWDDHFPRVLITSQSPRTGGTVETRFLVWGLYLGIKDMIQSTRFKSVQFVLRWEGQMIGLISIKSRVGPLSLPGRNSTNSTTDLRQRSSSNRPDLFASETPDDASFNLSVPITPSSPNTELSVEVMTSGVPLPKHSIILAVLDGILAVASHTTRTAVEDLVQVDPEAPYGAMLKVLPEPAGYGGPYLTYGITALAIRQIPAALLMRVRQWVEIDFYILIDDVLVAKGAISNV